MSEPISGPLSPTPIEPTAVLGQNVPLLSKEMQTRVLQFADHLQKILVDPSLSAQLPFLQEFLANATQLNKTVEQAILLR